MPQPQTNICSLHLYFHKIQYSSMNSSNPVDYQKFPTSPAPSAPPPIFNQSTIATGVPVGSTNQYYNEKPTAAFQTQSGHPATWSTGLCDCGDDVGNCCITCWCPCITFGQISEIVDKGTSSCVANGAIYTLIALLTGCRCIYSCYYRSKLRRQYSLTEGSCPDFLVHCCCESCALCQEYRELKNRGFDMSIGIFLSLSIYTFFSICFLAVFLVMGCNCACSLNLFRMGW
ncbi:hypothetical protein HHK36_024493 [Tetracentron sinense]|uniref:Uncharacterized protein n=1 Tax=Tetracentron sinense TaxID=13715 RepID=A0A835D459_TETSI|nr:hypothetical protein HHK36_024493 [Tetracentron sinense]